MYTLLNKIQKNDIIEEEKTAWNCIIYTISIPYLYIYSATLVPRSVLQYGIYDI